MTNRFHSIFILVSLIGLGGLFVRIIADKVTTQDIYVSLKNEILNRPVMKHKIPLEATQNITMDFIPFQILSVDEVNQIVRLSSLTMMTWSFDELSWEPNDYNISCLYVDSDNIWKPLVGMPKAHANPVIEIPNVITLTHERFMASSPATISTTCNLDLTNFPFDSHNCTIVFIELHDFHLIPSPFPLTNFSLKQYFSTSTEWSLMDSDCYHVKRDIDNIYTECWFTMKRRSLFYILGVFVPIFLISFMAHFVFIIPVESGEKISFLVSIFVSMTIFISYINGIIPRSMDKIPRVFLLLGAILLNMVMCMLATFFVINRYHSDLNRQQKQADGKKQACLDERNTKTCPVIEMSHTNANNNTKSERSSNNNQVHPMDPPGGPHGEDGASGISVLSRKLKGGVCILCYGKLSCFQLDKMFFVLFLLISLVAYHYILPCECVIGG